MLVGTPEAMAPEVWDFEPATPASDLYGLGVIAYRILTGKRVFGTPDLADLVHHTRKTEPIPPSRRLDTVPKDLEALVLACLAKDPAKRPASARELREGLEACASAGTWTREDAIDWWERNDRLVATATPDVGKATSHPDVAPENGA
jgi:serine/threonine-protein kinase